MSNESQDFLFGGGVPSAKFPEIGATVTGTITEEPRLDEQRDLEGEVKTWSNGDTMKMLVVTLATTDRDPDIEDDDGLRRLYVKGSKDPKSKSMTAAIGAAVRKAKANGLEVGGRLTIRYSGDGEQERKGFNAPKQYDATYEPPSVAASGEFLDAAPAPAAATTPAPVAAPAADAGETAKQLLAMGISQQDVATATGLPLTIVAALANVVAASTA
jgi:hypothetical protein